MPYAVADTDVLIVGAGPVGLFLANECARRGLRWRLVEVHASQSEHSKALAIFPRTLEIFDMAGLVAPFLDVANRVTAIRLTTRERTLARMPFTPENSAYPFIAMVPQDVTERLLVQALARRGGAVEYQTSFVGAVQHEDRVDATVDRRGERQMITARFVVGCDGAHSKVRELLKLQFEGGEYRASFMLADIETNEAFPADEMQLCPNSDGPLAIFPMSATRRRIVAMIRESGGDAPSLDLVRALLAERAPAGIEALALHWSSCFHIHHRHVSRLREARMFVAGDAAHIHSPFGGQGMNTGLQDAWNLVWKLDLALRGHANDGLLDSYSEERVPVIKSVIETTDHLTRAMGTPNRLAEALRDAVIPIVSRLAPFQHALVQRLSELGIAYHGSPIVEGSGKRYIEDSMRGGSGICSRYLLLLDRNAAQPVVQAVRGFADSFAGLLELRLTGHTGILLVRPDGYVAFSGESDGGAELEPLRNVLSLQVAA
ncbi:MAG TPA: FAD-dependent monooxygenase [Rhodanobacteraceae bacterium]|nr:FAD-dependent monooxygenase [Rhodanobacteraceae bacterium]